MAMGSVVVVVRRRRFDVGGGGCSSLLRRELWFWCTVGGGCVGSLSVSWGRCAMASSISSFSVEMGKGGGW